MRVAIIPARGGSKRIPKKNIKLFCGKPIIAWSVEAAIESHLFDIVLVSTDDPEIKKTAELYGAQVNNFRPPELSDDYVGTNEVVSYEISELIKVGRNVSSVCCIYATAPFVTGGDLERGYRILAETKKSFAFSVTSFAFPVQRALVIDQNDSISPMFPDWINSRSQDLVDSYHDAGQFYWGTVKGFLSGKSMFSDDSAPVLLERKMVQDIDTYEDWERAEAMFKSLRIRD